MNTLSKVRTPKYFEELQELTQELGFSMSSDMGIQFLLQSLCASKPNGIFLELGTGTGLSLVHMLHAMDMNSQVISLDNDPTLIDNVARTLADEKRLQLLCVDGDKWIEAYEGEGFDLIFADAWPGKYSQLDKTLEMVKKGGFYVIDDLLPQPNWPEGHQAKAEALTAELETRTDFAITTMEWSTGILIATKIN
ncbi:MAG: class I SAM-dependent methyltransferase [Bacteroidota bacterium]